MLEFSAGFSAAKTRFATKMSNPRPGVSRVHVQAPAGDDEAEPTFVYEADFHIAGHPRVRPHLLSDEFFGRTRDLFSNVRQEGSFKRWSMSNHYEILTLRGLANRDYITSTDPKLNSLVALPNEVLCHVLGYWKATLPRLYDINPSFPRPSTTA